MSRPSPPHSPRSPLLRRAGQPPVDEVGDAALLVAIEQGDLTALGTLYDRHARSVWSVVARVTNGAADVEDIVHATFLKLPELAPAYDGRPSSKSWLCGIAVRLALRRGRSLRRFARIVARFGEIMRHYSALDPEVEAADREDLARVERAVAALPESKRAVLVLVEVEGMSQADVATALGIPVATVRTRLFGARQALRAAVGRKTEGTHGL